VKAKEFLVLIEESDRKNQLASQPLIQIAHHKMF